MQMAGGGDDNFTEKNWKKNVENLKIHGDVLEETGSSEDCRDESVVNNHSFVVGDEGKIIHVESIWGQFHVRKTKKNEMPRLSWSSSATQPRCLACSAKKYTGDFS